MSSMVNYAALLREWEERRPVAPLGPAIYTVTEMRAPDNDDDWHGEWYDYEIGGEPQWDDPQWVDRFLDGDWAQWAEHVGGELSIGVADSFETGVLLIMQDMFDLCGEIPDRVYVSERPEGHSMVVALRDGWAPGQKARRFLIGRTRVYLVRDAGAGSVTRH